MKEITLNDCPEIMSLEQFRIACHVSKRTAAYYLTTKLIPCQKSKKKTHAYKVKKSDVLSFLEDREKNPIKYVVPSPNRSRKDARYKETLKLDDHCILTAKKYYENFMKDEPSVLETSAIALITGYARTTVGRWISDGTIKGKMQCQGKYYVSKRSVVNFMVSKDCNSISRKSLKHIQMIKEIKKLL